LNAALMLFSSRIKQSPAEKFGADDFAGSPAGIVLRDSDFRTMGD